MSEAQAVAETDVDVEDETAADVESVVADVVAEEVEAGSDDAVVVVAAAAVVVAVVVH